MRKLSYGQTLKTVQETCGGVGGRRFIIRQNGSVFEDYSVYNPRTGKNYALLFQDNALAAILENQRAWTNLHGCSVSNFNALHIFIDEFFPRRTVESFRFNEQTSRAKAFDAQGLGMVIGLAPLWIPAIPVAVPILIAQDAHCAKLHKRFQAFRTGETTRQVLDTVGPPTRRHVGYGREIWNYSGANCFAQSLGFESDHLVWIFESYDPEGR